MSDPPDPRVTPWHPSHAPKGVADPASWSERARIWWEHLTVAKPEETLRTHMRCGRCQFGFVVRTGNYSYSTSEDVENWGTCCNPDCKHAWREVS